MTEGAGGEIRMLAGRAWRRLPWWLTNALWTVYEYRPTHAARLKRRARKAWRVAFEISQRYPHTIWFDSKGAQHTPFDNGDVPSR